MAVKMVNRVYKVLKLDCQKMIAERREIIDGEVWVEMETSFNSRDILHATFEAMQTSFAKMVM